MSTEQQKMHQLPEAIAKAITGMVNVEETAKRKKGKFEDDMFSLGFRSGHCISPAGKESALSLSSPECFQQIREAIVQGFAAEDRKLMLQPIESLDEGRKKERKKLQTSVGTKVRDLKNALERREIAAGEIEPEPEPEPEDSNPKGKTTVEKCMQMLINAANIARKEEEPDFDVVDFIRSLENAADWLVDNGSHQITPPQE